MAVTPNIGLVKQAGTEYGDYEITNENWDKIDEEIGKRGKTINGESADANGDYKVDEVEFARQILTNDAQQGSGTFLARATGGKASLSDGDAKLISVFGRMTHTGVVHENITLTVNAVPREEGEDTITAEIDRDTFVAYVSESGTTTLVYTDAWSANPSLYGVTVTGTPVSGDQIVIVYVKAVRGTITPSNPTRFISTGWNLYNHTNGYAKVVNYSDIFGFLIGGTYTKLEFSETLTGTKVTITPVDGYFEIPSDGYLFVTGGNNTDTYILMTWSDWDEGYEGGWQAYTEDVIDFSTIMTNAFPYGLFQIGSVADEINFDKQKTYSRIQRIAYTDAAAEQAAASGRPWDADENYIYIVRETEQEYGFSTSINGTYTASDHGMEIIDGGTVPVYVQTIYGRNLVDYIRHDVPSALTEHSQAIQKLSDAMTYVVSGNKSVETASIPAGSFVRLVNSSIAGRADGIYTAKKAIPVAPDTIDDTYLNETAPISGGVGNALNNKLTNKVIWQTAASEAISSTNAWTDFTNQISIDTNCLYYVTLTIDNKPTLFHFICSGADLLALNQAVGGILVWDTDGTTNKGCYIAYNSTSQKMQYYCGSACLSGKTKQIYVMKIATKG